MLTCSLLQTDILERTPGLLFTDLERFSLFTGLHFKIAKTGLFRPTSRYTFLGLPGLPTFVIFLLNHSAILSDFDILAKERKS